MSDTSTDRPVVGRISGVFGVKGWVKISSFTEPPENLFEYSSWRIKFRNEWQELEIDKVQRHKDGWIAHINGVDDRDKADAYKLKDITVDKSEFADLDDGDFYWHQLVGLKVFSQHDNNGEMLDLGVVHQMLETGANDVLVVRSDDSSLDDLERLIPYVPDIYVKSVDLEAKQIIVDWDANWNVED